VKGIMGNSNTDHSKKLRRQSSEKRVQRVLDEGGLRLFALLEKKHADVFRQLETRGMTKKAALIHLIEFYEQHHKDEK
jgi:hypothetical protein